MNTIKLSSTPRREHGSICVGAVICPNSQREPRYVILEYAIGVDHVQIKHNPLRGLTLILVIGVINEVSTLFGC